MLWKAEKWTDVQIKNLLVMAFKIAAATGQATSVSSLLSQHACSTLEGTSIATRWQGHPVQRVLLVQGSEALEMMTWAGKVLPSKRSSACEKAPGWWLPSRALAPPQKRDLSLQVQRDHFVISSERYLTGFHPWLQLQRSPPHLHNYFAVIHYWCLKNQLNHKAQ